MAGYLRLLRSGAPDGERWFVRFCASVENYLFKGAHPAARNWVAGRTPPLTEYLVQRDNDSAVETAIDLIELARGLEIP